MDFLTEEQLKTIRFEDFENDVLHGAQFRMLNGICFKAALESEDDHDSISYTSADDFRQGSCELFALALQRNYQYPIYELRDCSSVHWFCKTVVRGKIAYIDVRGITFDFKTFLHELNVSAERDGSILYDIDRIDLESVVNKVGIAFAEWIIQNAGSRYDITTYLQI